MAIHKKEEFTQKEQDLAEFAKALAHPARIAILKVLAQRNECICGEIVEILPLAQSTVSQHLKELKNAGLIVRLIKSSTSCSNFARVNVLTKCFGIPSTGII